MPKNNGNEKRFDINRFASYCKLTCYGGSENGQCPCYSPQQCKLQHDPNFRAARKEATIRMKRALGIKEI